MSALAGDDSGEEFEENLLVDEDELDAGGSRACLASLAEGVVGLATPGSYFTHSSMLPSGCARSGS